MTNPIPGADAFNGDDAALCQSIDALLSLDAEGALVPHGLGGHARKLLNTASLRLAAKVGANVAITDEQLERIIETATSQNCGTGSDGDWAIAIGVRDAMLAAGAPAETPKGVIPANVDLDAPGEVNEKLLAYLNSAGQTSPAETPKPVSKEWCQKMAEREIEFDGNIEAGAAQPSPAPKNRSE